jgi:hypothetical protein
MLSTIFWYVTPCNLLDILLVAVASFSLLFNREDGGMRASEESIELHVVTSEKL